MVVVVVTLKPEQGEGDEVMRLRSDFCPWFCWLFCFVLFSKPGNGIKFVYFLCWRGEGSLVIRFLLLVSYCRHLRNLKKRYSRSATIRVIFV